jgi:hypothetical protein
MSLLLLLLRVVDAVVRLLTRSAADHTAGNELRATGNSALDEPAAFTAPASGAFTDRGLAFARQRRSQSLLLRPLLN